MNEARRKRRRGIRHDWLEAVIGQSQVAAGHVLFGDAEDARQGLLTFAGQLEPARNQVERLVLRSVLVEFAARTGGQMHARVRTERGACGCKLGPASLLERFWHNPSEQPQGAFVRWLDGFFDELERAHPQTPAALAARLIRREYREPWTVRTLGQRAHVAPPQLARKFLKERGMSISVYQRTVRVVQALERIRDDRVGDLAAFVGFKSKKNFYRALAHLIGLTPTEFRHLPQEKSAGIIDSLRMSLARRD